MAKNLLKINQALNSPRTRVKKSANQTTTDSVEAALSWDGEDFDVGNLHDTVTNNDRITVPAGNAGLWLVGANVAWASNSTGFRVLSIARYNSGGVAQEYISFERKSANLNSEQSQSGLVLASAGDYFQVRVSQTSTAALDVLATGGVGLTAATRFWAIQVS